MQNLFDRHYQSLDPSAWLDEVQLFNFQYKFPDNLITEITKSEQEVKKHRDAFISFQKLSYFHWAVTAHIWMKMAKYKLARLRDMAEYISCTQAVSKKQLAARDVKFECIRTVQPSWGEPAVCLMRAFFLEVYTAIDHLLERFGRRPGMQPGGQSFELPTLPDSQGTIILGTPLRDSEQHALEKRIQKLVKAKPKASKPGSSSIFVESAMKDTNKPEITELLNRLFHEAHMLCLLYRVSVYKELLRLHLDIKGDSRQVCSISELVIKEESNADADPGYDTDETIDEMNPAPERTEQNFSDSMLGSSGNCENLGLENIKQEMIPLGDESYEDCSTGKQHQDEASDTDDAMNEMPDPHQQLHAADQQKEQNLNPSPPDSSKDRELEAGNAHPGYSNHSDRIRQSKPPTTDVDTRNIIYSDRKRKRTEQDQCMVSPIEALTKLGEISNVGRMMRNGRIFKVPT